MEMNVKSMNGKKKSMIQNWKVNLDIKEINKQENNVEL